MSASLREKVGISGPCYRRERQVVDEGCGVATRMILKPVRGDDWGHTGTEGDTVQTPAAVGILTMEESLIWEPCREEGLTVKALLGSGRKASLSV